MIDKISTLPVFAQVLFGLILLGAIAFILYFAGKYGLSFKGKTFSLSLGKDEKKEKQSLSPHSPCNHRVDGLFTLRRIRTLEGQIFEQRHNRLINRQMAHIKSAAKQITNRYIQIYTTLLKGKGKDDPIRTRSCRSYMLILRIIESSITGYYHDLMKENHLATKSDGDFESYIEEKSIDAANLITDLMNDLYFYDKTITRAELYDENVRKDSDFNHIMRNCLIRCRQSAFASDEIIAVMTTESEKEFAKFAS